MIQNILLVSVSSKPTKTLEQVINHEGKTCSKMETMTSAKTKLIQFGHTQTGEKHAQHYQDIDAFIAELENHEDYKHGLVEARQWIAEQFYAEEGDTIRSLRLKKGWSQDQFAEALALNRTEIARIETGEANLSIHLCRKLCKIFNIDLNTLNAMLEHQATMTQQTVGTE